MDRSDVAKINEWVTWFNWHADKVAAYPLERKMEWTLKGINGLYECMTIIARNLHQPRAVRRPDGNMTQGGILLPNAARFDGKRA